MAVITPPFVQQGGSHPAATFRQMLMGSTGSPTGTFAGGVQPTTGGGGHGIWSATDLVATQNGTPNMSVNVAAGGCFVRGTEAAAQGVYAAFNDATLNVVIAASDPTNPRRDLLVMRVRDAFYSGASTDVALAIVTGTPAGVPVDPAVPVNCLVIARIAVGAAVVTILNANITSLTPRASSLGGLVFCTSTTRPTGSALFAGLVIYEIDTFRRAMHDGTGWLCLHEPTQTWTPQVDQGVTTNIAKVGGNTVATYVRRGNRCAAIATIQMNGPGTAGSNVAVSLPFTPSVSLLSTIGNFFIGDVSVGYYSGSAVYGLTASRVVGVAHGLGTPIGATPSFALAVGDTVSFEVEFVMASPYL